MHCPRCLRTYRPPHSRCPFDDEALTDRAVAELVEGRASSRESGVYCGRYAIRAALGHGAMTSVFQAEDVFTGDTVAVKVLDERFAHDADVRRRFLMEAVATQRVDHPAVARTLEAGEGADGLPFLVVELLPGEPLSERLGREPRMAGRTALRVLSRIGSALAAAHAVGIVHRDIKPANIMLLGGADLPSEAKLLDFGFAKLHDQPGFTVEGTAVGTVEYMAPEQVVSEPVDGRTDVFGLGVVMFRLFTGRLPFDSTGVDRLADQLITPAPSPRTFAAEVDARVEAVMLAALRKDPAQRYPDMAAFVEDLARLGTSDRRTLRASSLPVGRDVYRPSTPYGQTATAFLYQRKGLAPPIWGG